MRTSTTFISGVSARQFWRGSFFREYQHRFLSRHGHSLQGSVVEIGAETQYGHHQHFPNADPYVATNLNGDVGVIADATANPFRTGSIDAVVCVSVVEHIRDIESAFAEFSRVLRPGGVLVLAVPFCYPIHDRQDYWRATDQTLLDLLGDHFDPVRVTRLGGKISTVAELLQRPVGRFGRRYLPMKVFGTAFAAAFGWLDQPDDSPLGFGIVAQRRAP